ncbi:hypothetical protein [Peribacillus simplex]
MEEKHPFFLDLEQASSLLDGCLMQPLKLTIAPSEGTICGANIQRS